MSLFVSQESDQPSQNSPTFTACTTQIAHIADVLSSITSINSQALMIIKPTGIIIYAEHNHIVNVQLTVDPSLFSQYSFHGQDELRLGVDISIISESFQSVTSIQKKPKGQTAELQQVTCYITYAGEGHPLIIEFEDHYISEKLEFLTFYLDIDYPDHPDDEEHLIINHSEIQFELILKSDVFANLLADLQQINTVELYIHILNEVKTLGKSRKSNIKYYKNELNFISKGPIGHLKLIYPSEKTILEKMQIFEKTATAAQLTPVNSSVQSCYNFSNFITIQKAVKLSTKCKVLKDLNGVLSIQLLCKNHNLPNYAGTLVTFHLLEISPMNVGSITTVETNVFDDESYIYKGIESEYKEDTENVGLNAGYEPLSMAAFQANPKEKQIAEIVQDGPERKKRKDRKESGIAIVGGAVEVPLFL